MKTLLIGLILAAVSAQASAVINPDWSTLQIQFGPILQPVTGEDVPEWAKLPNAKAWYEFQVAFEQGGIAGMIMAFRGVVIMDPNWKVIQWMDILSPGPADGSGSQPDSTPEPGTFVLLASGAVLLVLHRVRRGRPKGRLE